MATENLIRAEVEKLRKQQAANDAVTMQWLQAIHAQLVETNRLLVAASLASVPPPAG